MHLFDSLLNSPTETHTTHFILLASTLFENGSFETLFDTILSNSCLMISLNIILNLWLLASIIFPDLKQKKSNFIEKYKVCKKLSSHFDSLNEKQLILLRKVVIGLSIACAVGAFGSLVVFWYCFKLTLKIFVAK